MSEHITREQLAAILTHEGLVPRDAVEDPEGFDGGRTVAAIAMAAAAMALVEVTGSTRKGFPLAKTPSEALIRKNLEEKGNKTRVLPSLS